MNQLPPQGVRGSVTYINGKRVVERRDADDQPYILWLTFGETFWLKRRLN